LLSLIYSQNIKEEDFVNFPKPRLLNCVANSTLSYCNWVKVIKDYINMLLYYIVLIDLLIDFLIDILSIKLKN